ncbi:MAG: helix-turn-helix transcriptional regulator [Fulvivirga sp.]
MSNLHFKVLPPQASLAKYVRRILITTGDESTNEHLPIGPTGFAYFTYSRYPIALHFSDKVIASDKQLYIAGQLDHEMPYFKIKGPFFHVGLELRPTAPFNFFGLEGLVDGGAILSEVEPKTTAAFRERFASESDPLKVAEGLQDELNRRLDNVAPIAFLEQTLEVIYANNGNIEVNDLINQSGLSERHFRREFKRIIGIGPKQYCKVIQFNAAFEAVQTGNEEQIYAVALQNGYYDHAHFINDFKAILGQSPQEFLRSDHTFLRNYLGPE